MPSVHAYCRFAGVSYFAIMCLVLAGCGGNSDDGSSAGESSSEATSADSTLRPGQIPTTQPSTNVGGTRGDGKAGGDSDGSNNDDSNNDDSNNDDSNNDDWNDDEPAIVVAGPTLENDYPEYWGNIYFDERSKCANFVNRLDYDVEIESITVSSPLVLTTTCSPGSGESAAHGCAPGFILAAARGALCTLGVVFADGTDFAQNYLPRNEWRLSVVCTDSATEPCSAPEVAREGPTSTTPVKAIWTMVEPMRFCGGTDYADDQGNPGGEGYPPESGCTAEAAGTSAATPG